MIAYNAKGEYLYEENSGQLKEISAKWSLAAPPPPPGAKEGPPPLHGKITEDGNLTVAKEVPGQFGYVQAAVEGLTARARVRVAPALPIRQDFEKVPEGRVPGGWVNAQGKFVVVEKDGAKMLKKLATDQRPPLAKANTYIGPPDMKDYTIQADLMGSQKRGNLPDMGIGANRYTLMFRGNLQKLRISSWDAQPRVDHNIDFPWKAGVWYRAKLTVDVQGDKARVRGKVWPRDEKEPEAWTIKFEDPRPNREGSPALYGSATGVLENDPGAEAFYDNLSVTPNKK